MTVATVIQKYTTYLDNRSYRFFFKLPFITAKSTMVQNPICMFLFDFKHTIKLERLLVH